MDSNLNATTPIPTPPNHLKHALVGSFAGTLMEAIVHPIDTIRTRIKSNTKQNISFMAQAISMLKTEGASSYLKGLTCTLLSASISRGCYFYIYEKSKDFMIKEHIVEENLAPFISGFFAGFIGDLVEIPCDLVRTRMQLEPGHYDYRNVFDGFKKIYQHEGPTKLFRGGAVYFTLDAIDTGLTFGFYELFKKGFSLVFPGHDHHVSLSASLASSALSASVTAILTNPFDVLVTRIQMNKKDKKLKIVKLVEKIYEREGFQGFFKGLTGRIGQYGLSAVILFPTYEFLKSKFGLDLPEL